ncbi:MAG: SRPBCC family protein [Gordonia sp. (in: high G+C Gram-positive bacteria)]|uniref:type II toxin-antitoxin system Rv0910 family toxin n=1 Tax=Gordonia sp. (in: high G+C Gram-positive bacteria) TaxID=84139 RepID=UPI0039E25106
MAKVSDSVDVDMSVQEAWEHASDLSRYDEWLTLHDGWRGPVPGPDELAKGLKVSSVIKLKGARVRFNWTVEKYDPPKEVRLKGDGKGGVKAKLDLSIKPNGDGSTVTFLVDLGGLPLIGPAGKAAALATKKDLHASLANFRRVFG